MSTRGPRFVLAELGKNGQGERGGLAGAGLGAADDIAASQNERDGAKLDGRGIDVTHGAHAFENFLG